MCPCLVLFLFVRFSINREIKSLPGQDAHVKFLRGKEVKGLAVGLGYRLHGKQQRRVSRQQHWGTGVLQRHHREVEEIHANLQAASAQSRTKSESWNYVPVNAV